MDNKTAHSIVNVILPVAFASSFIGIFFFTYATNIEKQIVVNNVKYTVEDLLENITTFASDDIKNLLADQVGQIELGDMTKADKEVAQKNHDLLIMAAKFIGVLLTVSLVTSYLLAEKYKLDFYDIIGKNLILLVGVAIVEYIILTYIIANYISANPNIVKKSILELN